MILIPRGLFSRYRKQYSNRFRFYFKFSENKRKLSLIGLILLIFIFIQSRKSAECWSKLTNRNGKQKQRKMKMFSS